MIVQEERVRVLCAELRVLGGGRRASREVGCDEGRGGWAWEGVAFR